jgi:hypothetical protein
MNGTTGGDSAFPASAGRSSHGVPTKGSDLDATVRTLAAVSGAGALVAVLVGGVGGRLAMALLAAQNPEDTGTISDDGFTIGQFTVGGTIQLLAAALQLGLVAGLIYLVLRQLAMGPLWLRVASIAAGGAVVFVALLIDPDGVDFTALDPDWLPVVLFLAIPAIFVVLFSVLAERWLAPHSWFATAPLRNVGAVLVVWIPTGPLIVLLAAAVGIGVIWRQMSAKVPQGSRTGAAWAARSLLGIIGIWALIALVSDVNAVT